MGCTQCSLLLRKITGQHWILLFRYSRDSNFSYRREKCPNHNSEIKRATTGFWGTTIAPIQPQSTGTSWKAYKLLRGVGEGTNYDLQAETIDEDLRQRQNGASLIPGWESRQRTDNDQQTPHTAAETCDIKTRVLSSGTTPNNNGGKEGEQIQSCRSTRHTRQNYSALEAPRKGNKQLECGKGRYADTRGRTRNLPNDRQTL